MATSELGAVLEALTGAGPAETASAREMLCAALPHALVGDAAGTRLHPYQVRVLEGVRRMLEDLRAAGQEAIGVAADDVAAARSALAEAEAAAQCATTVVDEAKAAADAARTQKEDHKTSVVEAEEELARTHVSTQLEIDLRAQALAELNTAQTVAEAAEKSEAAGGPTPENDVSGLVLAFLEERHAEKALIAAVPAAFGIPAAARSDFDHFTLREAMRFVSGVVEALEAKLAVGAVDAANAEAERLGSWAILDVEREKAAELADGVAAADAKHRDAEVARHAALAEVNARQEALSAKLIAETLAGVRIQELERASETLERLANPPAPAPAPEAQLEQEALKEQQAPPQAMLEEAELEAPSAAMQVEGKLEAPAPALREEAKMEAPVSAMQDEAATSDAARAEAGEQDVEMPSAAQEAEAWAGDEPMAEAADATAKDIAAPIRTAPESLSMGGA